MGITRDILEQIKHGNGVTVLDIAQNTQYTRAKIRAALWRMAGSGRVTREKVKTHAAKGPQSVYAYTIGGTECQVSPQHKQE